MKRSLSVTVLFGGPSEEREVSRKSGRAVCAALRLLGHEVTALDLEGTDLPNIDERTTDVVFVALHGRFGEDGQVQRLLEERGIPYTGSGAAASGTAMDKAMSKQLFAAAGLPTARWEVVGRRNTSEEILEAVKRIGFPCVCKPRCNGSSFGVSMVDELSAFPKALSMAMEFEDEALIEEYVPGRELTVGILDDRALPVIEIVSARGFFDYEAKYVDRHTEYIVDVDLPIELQRRAQELGEAAHGALGCCAMSRVDMIMTPGGEFRILEVNTIPGLTQRSLLPKAAQKAGVDFPRLCEIALELALRRPAAQRTVPAAVSLQAARGAGVSVAAN